jgi:hypothetical protein
MADHIEIVREDLTASYRFRQNTHPPRPQFRNRGSHGETLKGELSQAITSISNNRRDMGIQTDNLLVLEILSDAISPGVLDRMLNSFRVWLVEEVSIPNTNNSRLVVQFEDKEAIDVFEQERALWESDDQSDRVLTYAQRRDLFACIEGIRRVSREDRYGQRLKRHLDAEQPLPTGMFTVNLDVWYNGDKSKITEIERQIRTALGTQGSTLLGDLFELPSLLLGRASVNEFTLNALLDMDIIASVDFPMGTISTEQCELYSVEFEPTIEDTLDDNAPLATILDSGVFSGNRLLFPLLVGEEDFDQTENTPSDLNGHGTGVAGIVAYGDFISYTNTANIFRSLVRICNGKVMHNENGATQYVEDKRPEQVIKEAIEYFHEEYHCRIFNLSSGDADHVYNDGRQMPWAELLDKLARELDIVIIVSAGNVTNPNIPEFSSRNELWEKCRDQLFLPEHRLIDPATTALGITVGSITRYSEPDNARAAITRLSVGDKDYMSVFTRIGEGVNGAIKPEFVDYGGNLALGQQTRGTDRWFDKDRLLLEPTLSNTTDKIFKGWCGTSFSAPHVTHIAARVEHALEAQIGEPPSANLIRALMASSAKYTPAMRNWVDSAKDPLFTGSKTPRQEQRLRLVGYGKIDDSVLFSGDHQVTLFAEDSLDLRSLHLYKIPVPTEFISIKGNKRIAVGFAYNPPTRLSRKAYIANSLWFEVFRRIEADALLSCIAKKEAGADEDVENIIEDFRKKCGAAFAPGCTEIQNSTLQQRVWEKGDRGGADLLWSDNEPYIYILVTGKEKFKHPDIGSPQQYALAITFSYDADIDIELRQKLQARAKTKVREQIRERTQVQI